MKSFIIAWKDFKIRFKDRRGFLLMIFMPLLLTAILGSALGKAMDGDDLPKTVIGYYQDGEDPLADTFRKDVLGGKALRDFVTVKTVSSEEQLKTMLKGGKIDAGIIIPAKWSDNLREGKLQEAKLLTDPGKSIQASIAQSVLLSFSERVTSVALSTNVVVTDVAKSVPVTTGQINIGAVAKEISDELQQIASSNEKIVKDETIGKKSVTATQYYAAGMGAMFLLFNATVGAKMILSERSSETLARLLSTPTSAWSVLVGKFLGTLLFSCIQFLLFLAGTHYGFGVDWGDNLAQLLAVGASYAVCVSGLSMILAALIHTEKTADIVSGVGVQVLSLLGGSMFPIYAFPDAVQKIANIAPNKWALTSFLDIMAGTSWSALWPAILILLTIGLMSVTVGTWRLKVR
ncbi:ABC transporter permease [Microbacteriaceae bacterium 4G12]